MMNKSTYRFRMALIVTVIVEVLLWGVLLTTWTLIRDVEPSFRFGRTWALWLLIGSTVLPVIFLLMLNWKSSALKRFAETGLMRHLVPQISTGIPLTRFLLFRVGIACVLVAMTTPQYGIKPTEAKLEGIDIMVAVDVSNSMMAEDLEPNRITLARRTIEQIVNRLKGDGIGIITFAGVSDVHVPITSDYNSVKSSIKSIKTDFPIQGTAIGEAIETCMASFDMENGANKAIVVISDGENHEDNAMLATQQAAELGVTIHTIGIGSDGGVPIPIYENDRQIGYKKDRQGNTVVTKLNEGMLREIADAGGGIYVLATKDHSAVHKVMEKLDEMESTESESIVFLDYEDHFYLWLIIGLVFLFVEYCIPEGDFAEKQNA